VLVDYEKVVLALKKAISEKGSHGQRDLLALISGLEAQHTLDEGLPEEALRLYGVAIGGALIRPALVAPRVERPDGPDDSPERRSGHGTSEEDNDMANTPAAREQERSAARPSRCRRRSSRQWSRGASRGVRRTRRAAREAGDGHRSAAREAAGQAASTAYRRSSAERDR
jgi:hypothetical protein